MVIQAKHLKPHGVFHSTVFHGMVKCITKPITQMVFLVMWSFIVNTTHGHVASSHSMVSTIPPPHPSAKSMRVNSILGLTERGFTRRFDIVSQ